MAALVMLNTKSMLERHLDVILSVEEKKHPLRFPPSDKYRFAEPNTDENIVFEEREKSNGIPLIKVIIFVCNFLEKIVFFVFFDRINFTYKIGHWYGISSSWLLFALIHIVRSLFIFSSKNYFCC